MPTVVSTHYDAVIIGAGFAGVRAVHEIRQRGLSVKLFEAAADVGGTWYFNRYPGARTDSDAWVYCYSFSKELLEEWDWPDVRPRWDHVRAYLRHVVERFDLRKHMQFNSRITAATYDEGANRWTVVTEQGDQCTCIYLISASGFQSIGQDLPYPGADRFKGQICVSMRWPNEPVDFSGKRVAVIGSGSTAVQILPLVAQTASHASMFQRTANYVLPARNHPLDPEERQGIKAKYDEIWRRVRQHVVGFPLIAAGRDFDSMSAERVTQVFDNAWEAGGHEFIFNTFDDLVGNLKSNTAASDYVRAKIRALVKDRKTAELLCPTHPITLKRPPVGTLYYETFNRSNVSLIDISSDPIHEITEGGIATRDATYDFDIIIYAIGFDAGTGALARVDVRGKDGATLKDKWADGPQTHLGTMVDGFPNMFMILGPHTAGGNMPPILENTVSWIGKVMDKLQAIGKNYIEPKAESVTAWGKHIQALFDATLFPRYIAGIRSFYTGSNIPGKAQAPQLYLGGFKRYADEQQEALDNGLRDFILERRPESVPTQGSSMRSLKSE